MSFEHDVYLAHKDGLLNEDLLSLFLPNGDIRPIEGPMWDYKTGYCKSSAVVPPEANFICELLRDVAGLYNAFGGYLIFAYRDDQALLFKKLINKDDFDKQSDRFFKCYIPISTFQVQATFLNEERNLLFVHIDKRSADRPPVAFKRNSSEKVQAYYFLKQTTYH